MLEQITDFVSNNTTMVIMIVIALVAMVGMFMFKRNTVQPDNSNTFSQFQMPTEGIRNDGVDGLCDLETGMCYPNNNSDNDTEYQIHQEQHMPPEMQQQMMQDQNTQQES
jgi:hypothetical protein